jgi:hypothetical protein
MPKEKKVLNWENMIFPMFFGKNSQKLQKFATKNRIKILDQI